ncbi:hypothetical protein QZH41_005460, partial [Actinostola sp. cb2023]
PEPETGDRDRDQETRDRDQRPEPRGPETMMTRGHRDPETRDQRPDDQKNQRPETRDQRQETRGTRDREQRQRPETRDPETRTRTRGPETETRDKRTENRDPFYLYTDYERQTRFNPSFPKYKNTAVRVDYRSLGKSDRLLLNHVNVTIKLTPNTPAFTLMSGETNPNYKIVIQNAVLKVRTVKVSPVLQLQHLNELKKGANAKYPIRRVDCKTYTIPSGNPSIHKSDLFNGLVPKRVVLAMVDSDSFNGSYIKNPFDFKLNQANSVTLTIDGEMIPFQPITLKLAQTKETNFMEAYQSLFSGTGRLFADSGIDIGRGDYNKGYGILAFDLTPDLCGSSDHFNQKQKGNVSLEIQFTTGLPNAVNLIDYGEFESIVEIDYSRHVTLDHST